MDDWMAMMTRITTTATTTCVFLENRKFVPPVIHPSCSRVYLGTLKYVFCRQTSEQALPVAGFAIRDSVASLRDETR